MRPQRSNLILDILFRGCEVYVVQIWSRLVEPFPRYSKWYPQQEEEEEEEEEDHGVF